MRIFQKHTSSHLGFTLLEILLVIAMLGIMAAIVIVAINPQRQLSQARDAARRSDVNTIAKGLEQYFIDSGNYPTVITPQYQEICATGAPDCTGYIDLSDLTPVYWSSIPVDPQAVYPGTGYEVAVFNSKATIRAPQAEIIPEGSSSSAIYSGVGSPSFAGLSCDVDPDYDSQWISTTQAAAESGSGCPEGYTHRGYVQNSDLSYQSLCTFKSTDPEGGSCDDGDLPTEGWACEGSGSIVYSSTNGQYPTQSAAEAARIPVYGDPQFLGGQCTNKTYTATGRVTDLRGYAGNPVDIAAGPLQGPITEAFITAGAQWNGYWGTSQYYTVTIRNQAGQESSGTFAFSVPGSGFFTGLQVNISPDDCGDPPGTIESYTCPVN